MTTARLDMARWKSSLHQPNQNLYFTEKWPSEFWCSGKYYHIEKSALVNYDRGYILPGNDYKDIDISNETNALGLYPTRNGIVYEILIGFKPGNYQVGIYIPGPNSYLLALGKSDMYPDLTNVEKRYLAFIPPEESPYGNPLLKLWAIANMPSWILKVYVRPGVDFEKPVIGFKVNKLQVREISKPDVFTEIEYYTQISGIW